MPSAGLARSRRRRLGGFALRAVVVAGLLVPIAWDEVQAQTLRESAAASTRGDLPTALGLALNHLQWHPWSRTAALAVARLYSRLDYAAWAEPYYHRVGLNRLDVADSHLRTLGLFRANRRDEAVAAYRAILDQYPDDILALRRLAAVRIAQGAATDALELAGRLTRIPDGAVIGHTLAGTILHDIGDTEHATAEFLEVLALDPQLVRMPLTPRSTFWSYLGQDLLTLGRAEEARGYLERALAEGNNAALAVMLASAHRQLGNLDEAERWWRAASGWNPQLAGPWLGLGRLALQRGRPEPAIALLQRAAELAPLDPSPAYSLSLARRRLGDIAEADRLQRRADQLRDAAGSGTTGTMTTIPAPARPSPSSSTDRKLEP